jgi:hypothetical protein
MYWYFDVVDMVHKAFLSCIGLLFLPETPSQVVFAFLVVSIYGVATLKLQPYVLDTDGTGAALSSASLWFMLLYGLISRMDVQSKDGCVCEPSSLLVCGLLLFGGLSVNVPPALLRALQRGSKRGSGARTALPHLLPCFHLCAVSRSVTRPCFESLCIAFNIDALCIAFNAQV